MKVTPFALAAMLTSVIVASMGISAQDGNDAQAAFTSFDLPIEGKLPSLRGAMAWLNSPPLTPADLRGKVVLFEFWTYTCINWLRASPYVRTI